MQYGGNPAWFERLEDFLVMPGAQKYSNLTALYSIHSFIRFEFLVLLNAAHCKATEREWHPSPLWFCWWPQSVRGQHPPTYTKWKYNSSAANGCLLSTPSREGRPKPCKLGISSCQLLVWYPPHSIASRCARLTRLGNGAYCFLHCRARSSDVSYVVYTWLATNVWCFLRASVRQFQVICQL